jgi:translation elongation factor EF-1beta
MLPWERDVYLALLTNAIKEKIEKDAIVRKQREAM